MSHITLHFSKCREQGFLPSHLHFYIFQGVGYYHQLESIQNTKIKLILSKFCFLPLFETFRRGYVLKWHKLRCYSGSQLNSEEGFSATKVPKSGYKRNLERKISIFVFWIDSSISIKSPEPGPVKYCFHSKDCSVTYKVTFSSQNTPISIVLIYWCHILLQHFNYTAPYMTFVIEISLIINYLSLTSCCNFEFPSG